MPSLKAIRKRIQSVKNTQQITKAMKMVSAAKLKRAQDAVEASRPYAGKLAALLANVSEGMGAEADPLLRRAENPETVELVVIAADRGLCGAYNAGICRRAAQWVGENQGKNLRITILGRKVGEFFKRRDEEIADKYTQLPRPSIEFAREVAEPLRRRFSAEEVDRIDLLFAAFESALTQTPTVETLLPVEAPEGDVGEGGQPPLEALLEPDAATLLGRLLPQYVDGRVYQALLEAQASEHGARMTAMDSATRNAGEMIHKLTLDMNRARQAAITTELMEIVGGAEALKG